MTEKTKKLLVILIFILVCVIIGWLIYYLFFRPFIAPPRPVYIPPVNIPPVTLPPIPSAVNIPIPPAINVAAPVIPSTVPSAPVTPPVGLGPVISYRATGDITAYQILETDSSKAPLLATNGTDLNYYNSQTGFFYTITPDGQRKLFSDLPFKNVEKVTWAPNGQKAILEYPDGSNLIYDFNTKKSVTLPAHWKDFVFSPDSQKIGFKDMRLDIENRYIATSDTNGGNFERIEALGDQDANVHMAWSPNNKYIAMFEKHTEAHRSEIYPIGFHGENYRLFTIEGRDMKYQYSPTGNAILYSAFNRNSDYKPMLWVENINPDLIGTGRRKLGIYTWADKCVFAGDYIIYCAVPKTLEAGVGFLPELADTTPDDIYKINIQTGVAELVAQPLIPTTIEKMIVSQDGQYIYWLEKNTGQVKKMNL